jgi:hypothetical protein
MTTKWGAKLKAANDYASISISEMRNDLQWLRNGRDNLVRVMHVLFRD